MQLCRAEEFNNAVRLRCGVSPCRTRRLRRRPELQAPGCANARAVPAAGASGCSSAELRNSIMRSACAVACLLVVLAGCAVGPNYKRPAVQTPAQYRQPAPADAALQS